MGGLTLLAVGLRTYHLDSGLWYDEIKTLVESVRPPLLEILTRFTSNNDHPLYSVLGHLSIVAFGEHAWSLRLPAAVFGIASVPMLYALGTRVGSRGEGAAAAGLLTVSYHHVWFSQNARGYTILLFTTLLGTHLLLRALERNGRGSYVAYGIVTALGAYTHLTMVLVAVSQALVVAARLLASPRGPARRRSWRHAALGFGVAAALTLLLYGPILPDVADFFVEDGQNAGEERVATAGWALLELLRRLRAGFSTAIGVVVGGGIFLAGCWSYFRESRTALALFLLPGPIMLATAIVMNRPVFPRFFFFLAGFAVLIAVRGAFVLGSVVARRLASPRHGRHAGRITTGAVVAGMAVLSAAALPYNYRYPKQAYGEALRYVDGQVRAEDTVVVAGGGAAVPYREYYRRSWSRIEAADELAALRRGTGDVWVLYTFPRYIEANTPELMEAIRTGCSPEADFTGTVAGGTIRVRKCAGADADEAAGRRR